MIKFPDSLHGFQNEYVSCQNVAPLIAANTLSTFDVMACEQVFSASSTTLGHHSTYDAAVIAGTRVPETTRL
jgi:hypothetical protein